MKVSSLVLATLAFVLGTTLPATVHAAPTFVYDIPEGWAEKSDDTGDYLAPEASAGDEDDDIRIYLEVADVEPDTKKLFETLPLTRLASGYADSYQTIAKGFRFGDSEIATDGVYPNLTISGSGTGVGARKGWKYTIDLNFLLSSKKKAHLTNATDYLAKLEGPLLTIVILSSDLAYHKYDEDVNFLFDSIKFK